MPIRINLLAEVQAAEELRRQDPVKRAIIGAVAVIVVVCVWAGLLVWQGMQQQKLLVERQQQWNSLKPRYDAIKRNDTLKVEIDKKVEMLDDYATNRWLWAPVLNSLAQASTNRFATNIQVTRLNAEQFFFDAPMIKAVTNSTGKIVTPARPAGKLEQNKLTITGRDYGDTNYKGLMDALKDNPGIKSLVEPGGAVGLVNRRPGAVDPMQPNARMYYDFALECKFAEKYH